jgi:hypothetical protein
MTTIGSLGALRRKALMVSKPFHVGHGDVDDRDVERVGLDGLRAVVAAFREHDRVALALQNGLHHEPDHGVVIDHQDACHAEHSPPARRVDINAELS